MQNESGKLINDGGEGKIFEVKNNNDLLIKLYKEKDLSGNPIVTKELQQKLEYMKNHPPLSLINKGCLAWPLEIIYKNGKMTGFTMPKLKSDASLLEIYAYKHPLIDETYDSSPSIQSRIGAAINLTYAVSELHKAGYVVGDMNHENIGINKKNGQIQIFDCDSFTITDDKKRTFRTKVCMPGYLAPEIIRHSNSERAKGKPYNLDTVALPTFTKESDLFCLAVHIFRSLFNGVSPFLGVKNNARGSTAAPSVGNTGIERNNYVFKQGLHPSAVYCLKENEIPSYIKALFDRAFIDGNINPKSRPSAVEWHEALSKYLASIKQCSDNPKHQYYDKLSYCPFCKADENHYKIQHGGASQPKSSFNNQAKPKPIVTQKQKKPASNHQPKTQYQSGYQYYAAAVQASSANASGTKASGFQWNHNKAYKILAAAAITAGLILILPKGKIKQAAPASKSPVTKEEVQTKQVSQTQKQTVTKTQTSAQTTVKSQTGSQTTTKTQTGSQTSSSKNPENFKTKKYVQKAINLRSGPAETYKSLCVIPQNSIVYLDTSKAGVWKEILYKNQTGYVNSSFLRDFAITNVRVGNHNDQGYWVTYPEQGLLYAKEMEHLGIELTFATQNNYSQNTRLLLKIITPKNTYLQGNNVNTGYSGLWEIPIQSGSFSCGTFSIPSYYYKNCPGTWRVELYWENPNNANTFGCIASKQFTLY